MPAVPPRLIVLVALALLGQLPATHAPTPALDRVVFSLTTIPSRLDKIDIVLDQLLGQSRRPDAVYLALPPSVGMLPGWLEERLGQHAELRVLWMEADYGPASKLLAAVVDGGERGENTLLVYGDDDILLPPTILERHREAHQRAAPVRAAFGTRRIELAGGTRRETLLEATGTISIRASDVPRPGHSKMFEVGDAAYSGGVGKADACRLSDDYWLSHHLAAAGLSFELLPGCVYDYNRGEWPSSCGAPFEAVPAIENIDALSQALLVGGQLQARGGGDWRAQLARYVECQSLLLQSESHGEL